MPRLASVRNDLAALGKMAPLRALYEVGKRSGAHGLTLRSMANTAKPANLEVVQELRPSHELSSLAVDRCLEDSRRIVQEGHRAFGLRLPVNGPDDWNALGDTGKTWPSQPFWWQIDIRSEQRLGDVKWTWEVGRHRDLVVLARAAYLQPDERWIDDLSQRLRWWFEITPAERGIHWYSNLEIALRTIAWMQVYALCSAALPPDVVAMMALHVARARRHLLVDFPYTASSMRNNHLLGDALGILAIERFVGHSGESRLSRIAERAFAGQLERHMRRDGSMIEDSVSYHRFVMEMFAVKHLLGDRKEPTQQALRGSAAHLQRLGALEGPLPQWGDWDEGRVLASSGDEVDLAGSTALGLVLTGTGDPRWWSDFDEVAWYAPSTAMASDASDTVSRDQSPGSATLTTSGGVTAVVVGDWRVWFKCGTGPSHQHADITHVSARFKDRWVLVDPGTGTYNGDLEIRNAFRTSRAHNGLRIQGEQMLMPHRAFRWLTSANVHVGAAFRTAGTVVVWGVHDAYERLDGGGQVARAVVVTAEGLTVVDWRQRWQDALLTVPFPPGTSFPGDTVELEDGEALTLRGLEKAKTTQGSEHPFGGSHSFTYGRWEPAPWLEQSVDGQEPTSWGVALPGTTGHEVSVDAGEVTVAGLKLGLTFLTDGASMSITEGGRTQIHTAGTDRT
ncbi:MAG: heparinase II/III family protein [Actinobacteria bacterium]|nr:heparinase II/III family protein [Actinomycetota bacterium]